MSMSPADAHRFLRCQPRPVASYDALLPDLVAASEHAEPRGEEP
jgi:hypothetical protein